jgi:hypothetical protein
VEDALREREDDGMDALDDFAERVNRAQREEAEEQHGLRSDWWWPKAETIDDAKKEREGRYVGQRRERLAVTLLHKAPSWKRARTGGVVLSCHLRDTQIS